MKRYKFPSNDKNFFIHCNREPYSETHCHDYWEFTIVAKGKILHKINQLERTVNENTLLVIRPNDVHSLIESDKQEIVYINIGIKDYVFKTLLSVLSDGLYEFLLKGNFVEFEISKSTTIYFLNSFNKLQTTIHNQRVSENYLSTIVISIIRELLQCVNHSREEKNIALPSMSLSNVCANPKT